MPSSVNQLTMSHVSVANLKGRALDAAIAERLFGWKWQKVVAVGQPPVLDSYVLGPASMPQLGMAIGEPVLFPSATVGRMFVREFCPHYSSDRSQMWLVIEELAKRGCTMDLQYKGAGREYEFTVEVTFTWRLLSVGGGVATHAPEAVVRAALHTLENIEAIERRPNGAVSSTLVEIPGKMTPNADMPEASGHRKIPGSHDEAVEMVRRKYPNAGSVQQNNGRYYIASEGEMLSKMNPGKKLSGCFPRESQAWEHAALLLEDEGDGRGE